MRLKGIFFMGFLHTEKVFTAMRCDCRLLTRIAPCRKHLAGPTEDGCGNRKSRVDNLCAL